MSTLSPTEESKWTSLFDGKSLDGWSSTQFGGEGSVSVQKGMIILEMGNDLTGITWQRDLPKVNYEVTLDAQRIQGIDFFCALTFPVKDEFCTFVVGGWSGGVVGLSSIDGYDASENETTLYRTFEDRHWYRISVRVTEDEITASIDDKQLVKVRTKGRRFSVRGEVDLSRPMGIASYRTVAGLRDIRLRKLTQAERATPAK